MHALTEYGFLRSESLHHHVLPQRRVAVRPHRLVPRRLPRRLGAGQARQTPALLALSRGGGHRHARWRPGRPHEGAPTTFCGALCLWRRGRRLLLPPLLAPRACAAALLAPAAQTAMLADLAAAALLAPAALSAVLADAAAAALLALGAHSAVFADLAAAALLALVAPTTVLADAAAAALLALGEPAAVLADDVLLFIAVVLTSRL